MSSIEITITEIMGLIDRFNSLWETGDKISELEDGWE